LFLNLNNNYFKEAKALSDEYNKTIDEFAAKYVIEIKKDNQTAKNIENLLKEWKSDELEPNDDNLEVENYQDAGFDKALLFRLKFLIRKSALSKYDKSIGLTSKDNQLMGLIPKIKESDMPIHDRIGQLAYFKKYLEGILKGISDNIFADIPILYKEFRLTALDKDFGYEPKLLGELVKRNENKRLHKNEQAFLLYFINTLVKKVSKISPPTYAESNHPYFKSFKENSRPVIGVDEATDFHVMDLIAIHSFGDLDISSITYSGDLMQRMTSFGLKNWTELSLLVDNFHVKELTISYRQSFTLLNVAKAVYENATQKVANYTSYLEEDISEPKPLLFQYDDKQCAIDWIATRVHEIYTAYGDAIPSIAIFLPSENELESFAKELGEMDELADVGIKVKACRNGEVLGDTNTIRVFSRQFIKGLEFEAVFFHNVDKLEDNIEHQENLLKHLYVGLSRATLYLAVTVMQEFKNELGFLNQLFEKKILSWKLK
jgi:superfamily I DNA/RNA helicase